MFQDFFRRIDGTDEFTHSVVGFDFQVKVAGRGPVVLHDVGIPEGPEAEAVFCAALA